MKTVIRHFLILSVLPSIGAFSLYGDPIEAPLHTFFGQIEETVPGKINLNVRTRYEWFKTPAVDRKGFSQRLRYGYTTPSFGGFNAMIEGETLYAFNGSENIHPLDQQGQGTELNQLWFQYVDPELGSARFGRQIYTLDDHRFVGHVGWRQNIQTFDAATLAFTAVEKLTFRGFYINRVNRVTGTDLAMDGIGVNANYAFGPWLDVTGFHYWLDFDRMEGFSNDTVGVRLAGSYELDIVQVDYSASYAYQTDNGGSGARDFDLNYFGGGLSGTAHGVTLGSGFEILEGDGAEGFRTPLATVHAFNGFADKFLPLGGFPQGLEDLYVFAGYRIPLVNGVPIRVIHHWFSPQSGPGRYGREIDLVASYKINEYFDVIAKYGTYTAASDAVGVGAGDKDMFTFELNFTY